MKLTRKRKMGLLQEIIDDPKNKASDRLKALAQYEKLRRSKKKGKPRGKPFVKKLTVFEQVIEREKARAMEQQIARQHSLAESRRAKEAIENPTITTTESDGGVVVDTPAPIKLSEDLRRIMAEDADNCRKQSTRTADLDF